MQKNLMILKLRAALDCPRSLSTHEYSESQRNDEPRLPRNSLGTSGNVVGGLLVRGEPAEALFESSNIFASSSCRLRPLVTGKIAEQREGVTQEPLKYTKYQLHILPWRFRFGTLCIVQEALVRKKWWETGRNQVSDLYFDKFPDSCSNSGCSTIAMRWIKEVEVVKSVDDVLTSQSAEGRDFFDFQMLDAIIFDQHFRRRVDVEEQNAETYDGILEGRQIALMICDNFRTSDAVCQKLKREECQRGQENGRMLFISGEQSDSVQEKAVAIFATEVLVDNEHNRPLLLQERRHRLTEVNPRKRVKIFKGICTNPSCHYLHPPVCPKITSQNRDANSVCSDTMGLMVSWVKSKSSGGEGSIALLK